VNPFNTMLLAWNPSGYDTIDQEIHHPKSETYSKNYDTLPPAHNKQPPSITQFMLKNHGENSEEYQQDSSNSWFFIWFLNYVCITWCIKGEGKRNCVRWYILCGSSKHETLEMYVFAKNGILKAPPHCFPWYLKGFLALVCSWDSGVGRSSWRSLPFFYPRYCTYSVEGKRYGQTTVTIKKSQRERKTTPVTINSNLLSYFSNLSLGGFRNPLFPISLLSQ